MNHIFKAEEFEVNGHWMCEDTTIGARNQWILHARIFNLDPADFIKKLISEYHISFIKYNPDTSFCYWWWNNQADMRKYKNKLNALARADAGKYCQYLE